MARYRTGPHQGRDNPWVASVQLNNKVYWLGSYPSKTLAMIAEAHFKWAVRRCQDEAYAMWQRQFFPACPHCDSRQMDWGATGLNLCESCGGLSREGKAIVNRT